MTEATGEVGVALVIAEPIGKNPAAELTDLPRCDQAPHAIRLTYRAWGFVTGRFSVQSTRVVVIVGIGAGGAVCAVPLSWPTAVLGSALILAVMWTVSNPDRTRHLASLIRAARKK